MNSALMQTYNPLPVHFTHGEGVWLYDSQGKRYLDAFSGLAVTNLGHAHPNITEAITEQAQALLHVSNVYEIVHQQTLAKQLCAMSQMDKAFFCNSGAEANEAAIKLCRLYGHQRGIQNPTIIVVEGAFHGRTMATLTATSSRKVQAGFEPLVQGFVRVPYDDVEAIKTIARNRQDIVGILVEPILGQGGVRCPAESYLAELRAICNEQHWLLALDEVQTGIGRTGKCFAYQHSDILPDVVACAKALGNGVPIGACLARGFAAELFQPGNHGSTFGGNPLCAHVAQRVLQTLKADKLFERAANIGEYLLDGFRHRLSSAPQVKEIRGKGMMIGIEMSHNATPLVKQALNAGLLINTSPETVVRLLPPLIYEQTHADQLLETLCPLILAHTAPALNA